MISPNLQYAQQYTGVTVQFTVQAGTADALLGIGVRNEANAFVGTPYESLPPVYSGWGSTSAYFKSEGEGIFNIGLGRGSALDTFNSNIIDFQPVSKQ